MSADNGMSKAESNEQFVLAMAAEKNQQKSKEWVEGFRGHEGIDHLPPSAHELCVQEGYVTINEQQIVRLTERGIARLDEIRRKNS